jgi:hypothetical protein
MQQLLTSGGRTVRNDVPFGLDRIREQAPATEPVKPLWLSTEEAELLVSLCLTSASTNNAGEGELLAKLGRFVRTFSR